jgi:hypothetical protein
MDVNSKVPLIRVALYKSPVPIDLLKNYNCELYDLRHDDNRTWTCNDLPFNEQYPVNVKSYNSDYLLAVKLLKSNLPIFARHFQDLQSFELKVRHYASQIAILAEFFRAEKITFVIVPSGASHHLGTLICDLAVYLSDSYIINLYPLEYSRNLSFELIPLISDGNLENRKVLPITFNNRNSSQIKLFLSQDDSERYAPSWVEDKDTISNFNIALIKKILESVKKFISHVFGRIIYLPYGSERLTPYSLKTWVKLLYEQKRAIYLLEGYISNDRKEVTKVTTEANGNPLLIIMAHAEPEMTVFPEGGEWYNFIDIVNNIRRLGWTGKILYKEHPQNLTFSVHGRTSQAGSARDSSYYHTLSRLGCLFVENNFNVLDKKGIIPLTITGSVTLERASMDLPTVVVGQPWYSQANCFISVEDLVSKDFELIRSKPYRKLLEDFILNKMQGRVIISYKNNKVMGSSINKTDSFIECMAALLGRLPDLIRLNETKENLG